MAPTVTRVVINDNTDQDTSWSPYRIPYWCIGPLLEHNLIKRCYMPTKPEKDSLTHYNSFQQPLNFQQQQNNIT